MIGRTGRAVALAALAVLTMMSPARAATVNYTKTFTVPAPPASDFPGADGGGDGWAVALSATRVYNVFHHQGTLMVNCHEQATAATCWGAEPGYKTVSDGAGHNFTTPNDPGLYLDEGNGHLYVPVVRSEDSVAGVACIDTSKPDDATGDELFCGFTVLTGAGAGGWSALTNPVQVGNEWFIYNSNNIGAADDAKMLCFNVTTAGTCANQPYAVAGVTTGYGGGAPIAAIAGRVMVQVYNPDVPGYQLACLDAATKGACAGTWPVTIGSVAGAPIPLLGPDGHTAGVCNRANSVECFDMSGSAVTDPPGIADVITPGETYNGPAVVIGSRAYVVDFYGTAVECYDFGGNGGLGAGCANFPKELVNANTNYTVNPDPRRPTCIWTNSDNGTAQIQSFDAFSAGACGAGPIRVLSSTVVVDDPSCTPGSYTALQVLDPVRASYETGSVEFADASGNALGSIPAHPLDSTGTADLTDLNLTTTGDFPQFLITLANPSVTISDVQLKLSWTGTYSPTCTTGGVTSDYTGPAPELPEAPLAILMPLSLAAVAGGVALVRRRRDPSAV